jgi:CheY-like chemotaxis protein
MNAFQTSDESKVLIVISRYADQDYYENLLRVKTSEFGGSRRNSFQFQVKQCSPSEVLTICQQEVYACIVLDRELADRKNDNLLQQLEAQKIAIVILLSESNADSEAHIVEGDRDYLIKETLTKGVRP